MHVKEPTSLLAKSRENSRWSGQTVQTGSYTWVERPIRVTFLKLTFRHPGRPGAAKSIIIIIKTLVYRLPTQTEEFFLVQPLLKKSIMGLNGFPSWQATMKTVLSMLIRGYKITLTGDWHSGRLAALSPSVMLRNSLLTEGKIRHCPGNVMTHPNDVSALKHKFL